MEESANKKWVFIAIFAITALAFIAQLASLQIFDDTYKQVANSNAIRKYTQYPARGYIYDRNGEVLVYNEVSYDLMVVPSEMAELDTAELCRLAGIPQAEFKKSLDQINKLIKQRRLGKSTPTAIVKQMGKLEVAALEEKMYKFPSFFLQPRILRKYPKPIAANVLGYISEVNDENLKNDPYYKPGDYIGNTGLEESYETVLRGVKGSKNVFVDNLGNPRGSYMNGEYDTASVAGKSLTTTLDMVLQEYGELLMQNKKGAIVAIEPESGEILAMVTSPGYDPNLLVGRGIRKNYGSLVMNEDLPLFNRAVMDGYPPGSTFKLLQAAIGLQLGVLKPETRYHCGGGFRVGGHIVKCHPHAPNPDLRYSIQTSCNPYYCATFRDIINSRNTAEEGYQVWRDYITAFGLGTNFPDSDLPNVKSGLIPKTSFYDKWYGKGKWKATTIISLGIGQGEIKTNALQLANMTAAIANRGWWITPHLGKAVDGQKLNMFKKNQTGIESQYMEIIAESMGLVMTGGTGRSVKIADLTMGGKTGTAQNPHGDNHSVFVSFAPLDKPKIAIGVLVENAGYGATWAAPIASLMIEKYLFREIKRTDMEKRMLQGNLIKKNKAAN